MGGVGAIDFLELVERLLAKRKNLKPTRRGLPAASFSSLSFKRAGDVVFDGLFTNFRHGGVNQMHRAIVAVADQSDMSHEGSTDFLGFVR